MNSILRQLSAIFLTVATTFAVMAILADRPDWKLALQENAASATQVAFDVAATANSKVILPSSAFAKEQGNDLYRWAFGRSQPHAKLAKTHPRKRHIVRVAKAHPSSGRAVALARKNSTPSRQHETAVAKPAPKSEVAATTPLPVTPLPESSNRATASRAGLDPGELVRVAQRLNSHLNPDLQNHFELFLYVSKANAGSWSQRMYVFAKKPGGDLDLLYNWPVSTGREKWEIDVNGKKQNSFTPEGYYQLDRERMFARYRSRQWNRPMPYAMFFNWEQAGYRTGLAIHGASPDELALIGTRASAGCVRLSPEHAKVLFDLIRSRYKGLAPKFAYDERSETMASNGQLMRDEKGQVVLVEGYKVLVFIENYGGGDVVAALF